MLIRQYKNQQFNRKGSFYDFSSGASSFIQVKELSNNTEGELILTIKNKINRVGSQATFVELYKKCKETGNDLYLSIKSIRWRF